MLLSGRKRSAPFGATALLALAVACGGGGDDAARRTLTLAVRADVTGFFPRLENEGYTFDVNWNIYEGLVRFDRQLGLEGALAERWETPDDRTYLFELRQDLRFSDGSPVLASDVAASLQAALDQRWATRDYLQEALARVAALRPILPLVVQTESVAISNELRWDPPINYAIRLTELRPAR